MCVTPCMPPIAVGDQRDPDRLALARRRACPSRGRGRRRGRVGDRGEAGREDAPAAAARDLRRVGDRAVATAALRAGARGRGARGARGRRARSRRTAGGRAARARSCARSTASSHARSRARASSGPRSQPIAPLRASPSRHHALDHPQHGGRVGRVGARRRGRARGSPAPSRRAPTSRPSPARRARSRGRRGRARGTRAASARAGVSDHVRPMSTPAWSSEPPTPVPPCVST